MDIDLVESQSWMVDRTSMALLGCWRLATGRLIVRTLGESRSDVVTTTDFSLVDMVDKN